MSHSIRELLLHIQTETQFLLNHSTDSLLEQREL